MPAANPAAAPPPCGTSAPRTTPTGRLGQGELRRLTAACLAASPGAHTPGEIARALGKSSGAVGNALTTLAGRGEAAREPGTPIRYRATPATAGVAAAPPPAPAPRPARPAPAAPPRPAAGPVPLENTIRPGDLRVLGDQAAWAYSLIRPPRTGVGGSVRCRGWSRWRGGCDGRCRGCPVRCPDAVGAEVCPERKEGLM